MTTALAHSGYITWRHIRNLLRQPWYIGITLAQPIIWLVFFGSLFRRVVDIPGIGVDNYIAFLTPGIVIMTALFSSGWNGMGLIEDINRGVMDRFLVSPVRRSALIAGPMGQQMINTVLQSLIMLGAGFALGARYASAVGVPILLLETVLLASALAGASNAIALLVRKEESLIATVQFTVTPLTFLSTALMPAAAVPTWVREVSRYNPVTWAAEASRSALSATPDWGLILSRTGFLAILLVVAMAWALRAFRSYQRSA